jgi:hypothetical protein
MTMNYHRDIAEELHAPKREALHAPNNKAQESQATSHHTAFSLVTDVKACLTDLRDALSLEEAEVEWAFARRVGAAMVTALAAGIVLGYLLNKRP